MRIIVNLNFETKAPPSLALKVKRRLKPFTKEVAVLFNKTQLKQVEVNLVICSNQKIRRLNRLYRNKDSVTDVLSFPLYNSVKELKKLIEVDLGDIYIALPYTKKQAKELKIPLEKEVIFLLIHGLLHLIGYDHERSEQDEKIMFDLEFKLAQKILK